MKYWLVPCNDKTYHIAQALHDNKGICDWGTRTSFAVGDIVFIYKVKPESCVRYKLRVIGVGIPESETIQRDEYLSAEAIEEKANGEEKYARFELIKEFLDNSISFHALKDNGMKGLLLSPRGVTGELLDYLLQQ